MAISNGYATLDELKAYLDIVHDDQDTNLEQAIEAASREVDSYCEREFFQAASATRYVGTARLGRTLEVPDIQHGGISSLKVDTNDDGTFDSTKVENTDFVVDPPNGQLEAGVQFPISGLVALTFAFPTSGLRPARVEIVANFGWAAIPDPVHTATLQLAAQRYQSKDAPLGFAGGEFGAIRVRDIPSIRGMLGRYRKHPVPV